MPIEIKHRSTDVVLHTVNAVSLSGAYLFRANLTGADLFKADLSRANLRGADLRGADLFKADLRGADLFNADLSRANLSEADLTGADLDGTDLTGADLYEANLSGATIGFDKLSHLLARATRLDNEEFFLFALQGDSPKIKAGCRWMIINDYRDHVEADYHDTDKAKETLDILNFFEARAR